MVHLTFGDMECWVREDEETKKETNQQSMPCQYAICLLAHMPICHASRKLSILDVNPKRTSCVYNVWCIELNIV